MSDLPTRVEVIEVGPRDGLQIEPRVLSVDEKRRMLEALVASGLREFEVGSFVNPKAVPQMADTSEVFDTIVKQPGVRYRGLWLNEKGLERALANGHVDMDGKLTITASETFVKRNTNRSIQDTLDQMPAWIAAYRAAGIETDMLTVMAAFGCNFEGYVPEETVMGLLARTMAVMEEHGCTLRTVSLADTMGWASPRQIRSLVGKVRGKWPELIDQAAPARHPRVRRGQCGGGDGDGRGVVRRVGGRARRLPVRRPQRGGGQHLHGRFRVRVR